MKTAKEKLNDFEAFMRKLEAKSAIARAVTDLRRAREEGVN